MSHQKQSRKTLAAFLVLAALTAPCCRTDIGKGANRSDTVIRVSLDGTDREGTDFSIAPSLSDDGMLVAFWSGSDTLVSSDSNNNPDVFVKDRRTRQVRMVSINTDQGNIQGQLQSSSPRISPDGRCVVFQSLSELTQGAAVAGVWTNLYLHDLQTGLTRPVIDRDIWPNLDCTSASVTVNSAGTSATVVFLTGASNLGVATGGFRQVVASTVSLVSAATPTLQVVSQSSGISANGDCASPQISADGSVVVFSSAATNLIALDASTDSDIYLGTPAGTNPLLVSRLDALTKANGISTDPSVSRDGSFVSFSTTAPNLVTTTGNIVRREILTGVNLVVSTNVLGALADNPCTLTRISADGQRVAFRSVARNLTAAGGNGRFQVFMKDVASGSIRVASTDEFGNLANASCDFPAISGDGHWVGWSTAATNLILIDLNGNADCYVRGPF